MWRCVNDIFSYCSNHPVWAVQPNSLNLGVGKSSLDTGSVIGGICQNSPNSCEHRQNASDIIKPKPPKPKSSRTRKK